MTAITKGFQGLGFLLKWFCVTLLAMLVLIVVLQVVARHAFNTGFSWTEALARIVFMWQGILGAAYVIGENDDVAIDFLVRKFPAVVARIVEAFAHAVVITFAVAIMIIGGGRFVSRTWDQTVELLPFTLGQVYLVLPLAGAIIVLYSLRNIGASLTRQMVAKNEDDIDITTLVEEGI